MTVTNRLWGPVAVGEIPLDNRLAMAPMTRPANLSLVDRAKTGAPLNEPDGTTFRRGGERGYAGYPTLPATTTAGARVA